MQLTDTRSDSSLELDTMFELTADTNDTISDSDNAPTYDNTGSRSASQAPTTSDDIHHFIQERLLSLDSFTTMALGTLNYYEHFNPHYIPPDKEGGFGKTLYKKAPPIEDDELGLVFFGEICPSTYGTAISAKGNHYVGTAENPKVRTVVLLVFAFDTHAKYR